MHHTSIGARRCVCVCVYIYIYIYIKASAKSRKKVNYISYLEDFGGVRVTDDPSMCDISKE